MLKDVEDKYGKMSQEDILKEMEVDPKQGLSSSKAKERLGKNGPNSLEGKEIPFWKKFFSSVKSPIAWMILTAAILSGLLRDWMDLSVILLMMIINGTLRFFQEYKADNAMAALKKKLAHQARVLRDGKWQMIPAPEVVCGDIVSVKIGNVIPADLKLLSGDYLTVDQSSLTGESLPVSKKTGDRAFSGTIVKTGEMAGVVTETGMNTFFGRTAKLVESASVESHFQKAIAKIGNVLIIATLITCSIILILSLYRIQVTHALEESLGDLAVFILVLIVAGIPIALPAVLSATLAIGASKLADLKAIVTKLAAIEEIASMDVLCSDKTGTLTQNKLTVGDIETFSDLQQDDLLLYASMAAQIDQHDPIDDAIYNKLQNKQGLTQYINKHFTPFDPVSKRTEAELEKDNITIYVTKGAPQVILEMTDSSEESKNKVLKSIDQFAQRGLRTLGVARSSDKKTWQFLGIISLYDPPREDTKNTLEKIKSLGVDVKMITGDHEAIAKELAKSLDLGVNIFSIRNIHEMKKTEAEKEQLLLEANGFAEVFPEHKFEIVKALQKANYYTGMTGDGVNDAPALKQADIGIAVSGASDAAQEAADLVLTEKGLFVISQAIEEARRIFGRMKSFTMYRISETCRILLFLLLAAIVFNNHPLSAIMLILIALLNDLPIMMIAYDKMAAAQKPVRWNMQEILTISIGLSIVGVISTFILFWIGQRFWFANITDLAHKFDMLKTLAFMGILCGGNLTIYLTRNVGAVWQKPLPEWKFFLSTLSSLIVGTFVSVYGIGNNFIGIGWKYVGFSWVYILIWFFICMFAKEGLYRLIKNKDYLHTENLYT